MTDKVDVYVNGCTCGGCSIDVAVFVDNVEAGVYWVEPYGDDSGLYTIYPEDDDDESILLDPPVSLENLAESIKSYHFLHTQDKPVN